MEEHPLVGRRILMWDDHIVRWEHGKPVAIHKAGTAAVIVDVPDKLDPAYPWPVIIIAVPGYQPHPICVKSQVSEGVWDANLEILFD